MCRYIIIYNHSVWQLQSAVQRVWGLLAFCFGFEDSLIDLITSAPEAAENCFQPKTIPWECQTTTKHRLNPVFQFLPIPLGFECPPCPPGTLFEARKVAGSATYEQSKTELSCVEISSPKQQSAPWSHMFSSLEQPKSTMLRTHRQSGTFDPLLLWTCWL